MDFGTCNELTPFQPGDMVHFKRLLPRDIALTRTSTRLFGFARLIPSIGKANLGPTAANRRLGRNLAFGDLGIVTKTLHHSNAWISSTYSSAGEPDAPSCYIIHWFSINGLALSYGSEIKAASSG
jgi:hypothetical protein